MLINSPHLPNIEHIADTSRGKRSALLDLRPDIISVSLSAFSREGPWADRRGFDSLVQTTTGFNHAEAEAAGTIEPRALPVQILDFPCSNRTLVAIPWASC